MRCSASDLCPQAHGDSGGCDKALPGLSGNQASVMATSAPASEVASQSRARGPLTS
jgi:hypothetical protein